MMHSHWRRKAAPIIAEVLAANAGRAEHEIREALRAAYPFGLRQHHPYRIWLDEIRVQTGRRPLSGRQRVMQDRPPEPGDSRQVELFG
ncbi:MAG: hypothetical protein M1541_04230 [Acidobacteria bacterium]|nr:hypothetical protein [Acidobacteriota bacterium]